MNALAVDAAVPLITKRSTLDPHRTCGKTPASGTLVLAVPDIAGPVDGDQVPVLLCLFLLGVFASRGGHIFTLRDTVTDPAKLLAAKDLELILTAEVLVTAHGILQHKCHAFVRKLGAHNVIRHETTAGLAGPSTVAERRPYEGRVHVGLDDGAKSSVPFLAGDFFSGAGGCKCSSVGGGGIGGDGTRRSGSRSAGSAGLISSGVEIAVVHRDASLGGMFFDGGGHD